MRCTVHSYVFYPESFLINELSFFLAGRGHQVCASTGLPNYTTGSYQSGYSLLDGPYYQKVNDVQIFRFPVVPRKKGLAFLTLNYLSNIISGVVNLVRLPKSEVSFVFSGSPIFVAIAPLLLKKITGRPVVLWLQDLWPESFGAVARIPHTHILYRFLEVAVRWIYKNSDVVMIQSEAFRANLEKYNFKGRIEYIPNWAPDTQQSDLTPEWVQNLPSDKFILTFAGNVGKAQSLDTLLDAAKKYSPSDKVLFLIVGDGSDLNRLKKRVDEEQITNIQFAGRKPLNEMPALFKKSSCLYVSLKSDFLFSQVVPSKVQAYLASSRPILASLDGEGARVVQESAGGLAVPTENAEKLHEAMQALLNKTPEQLQLMGSKSLQYYLQHFERGLILSKIENILKETIQ